MNVKPIPNKLLGDSLMLILPAKIGFVETPIANVRVERSDCIENYLGDDIRACAEITVWVDRCHSTWTEFPVGAKVRYASETFTITEQKVYFAGGPHHCKFKAKKIGDDDSV